MTFSVALSFISSYIVFSTDVWLYSKASLFEDLERARETLNSINPTDPEMDAKAAKDDC